MTEVFKYIDNQIPITEHFEISGALFAPRSYTKDVSFVVPDEIVDICARRYDLIRTGFVTLDPMCGLGTIPRVLQSYGAVALGLEIDPEKCQAMRDVGLNNIQHTDLRDADIEPQSIDCIFVSMPFDLFKSPESASDLDPRYAVSFAKWLKPGGFILLDTMKQVKRQGETWNPAQNQMHYLYKHGFKAVEVTSFKSNRLGDTEPNSLIIKLELQ